MKENLHKTNENIHLMKQVIWKLSVDEIPWERTLCSFQ